MILPIVTYSYHRTVCDKADQGVLWKQAEAHDQRFLERSQTVIFLAQIDNIEEYGRSWGRSRQSILNRCVCGMQFGWNRVLRYVLVVGGQRVSRQAERADPDSSANIDLAMDVVSQTKQPKLGGIPWPTKMGSAQSGTAACK